VKAPTLFLLLVSLSMGLGCQTQPESLEREPKVELAPTTARGEDRSALLERQAQTEEEALRWRTTARELRRELKRAREVHDGMSDELTVARRNLRKAEAEREQALLREAAVTRQYREVVQRVAQRELERLRAERKALEAEVAMLEDSAPAPNTVSRKDARGGAQ